MRAGITWTGVAVFVLGLIVVGAAYAYTSVDGEWLGGVISVVGFFVGIAGAMLSRPTAATTAKP
jgi:hypothetical protein